MICSKCFEWSVEASYVATFLAELTQSLDRLAIFTIVIEGRSDSTVPDICYLCPIKGTSSEVKEFLKLFRRKNLKSIGDQMKIKEP